MSDYQVVLDELKRANQLLSSLAGENVDAIDVKSVESREAPFLAKIVSKLSPMVGNLMEQRVVSVLDENAAHGYSWVRQDPGFPDAVLVDRHGAVTTAGYEIKAWYVLSTEITGRFRESQNLLAGKDVNVVIIAWCMSHLVFGKPKILGVFTSPGLDLAASRDKHYHKPPEYLIIEPGNTTARTANLQQSNVNGYKLQVDASHKKAVEDARLHYLLNPFTGNPHSPEAQSEAVDLMSRLTYRLDTNFAKIDRVGNSGVENFKNQIMRERYLGRTIAQWKTVFSDLNGQDVLKRKRAEAIILSVYDQMLRQEPRTEIVTALPGV